MGARWPEGLPCSQGSFTGAAGAWLSTGLPAKAPSWHFVTKDSSNRRVILLSIFFLKESLPSFLAEVKWKQGQLGHTEVITLVTNFLSLWSVLM